MATDVFSQRIQNMTALSTYVRPGTQQASSGIWGWTSSTGKEYALLTSRTPGGVSVVDISTPTAPRLVKFYAAGHNSIWFEVNSSGNYVYMVSQQGTMGLFTLDMSPLNNESPGEPVQLPNNNSFFTNAHTVWVDNTVNPPLLWATPGQQSMVVLSLANPRAPTRIRAWDPAGASHDIFVRGAFGCHATVSSRLDLWNTSDPNNVTVTGTINGLAVTHNCFPTEDNKTLLVTGETTSAPLWIYNISNPASPVRVSTWTGVSGVIAHNAYVAGNVGWIAHYTGGLWAVNISNPASPVTLGFQRPSSSTETYGGTWGAYPWFKSGNVIHGDDEQGLFVVKPNWASTDAEKRAEAAKFAITPLDGGMQFRLPGAGAYALQVFNPAGKQILNHRGVAGSGLQKLSLGSLSNGNYMVKVNQGNQLFSSPLAIRN